MEISQLDKAYAYLGIIQEKQALFKEGKEYLSVEQVKYGKELIKVEENLKGLIRKLLNNSNVKS